MMLTTSLVHYLEANGGKVLTNASVSEFIVDSDKTAKGIQLADGTEILARKAVVTSLDPRQTFLRLVKEHHLNEEFLRMVRNFSFGTVSLCRVHYALNEAPNFKDNPEINQTAFQRIFGSMADIDRQYLEIAGGVAPTNPFLWTACWTTKDPTRAPEGKHTLIMDTFVPNWLSNGERWEDIKEDYVQDVLLRKLQEYTSNMTESNILGQYIDTGESIARDNLSFVNGTTTGGERTLSQSGYFRPFPGYAHYRSPIRNLYMTGPSCHPGGGISAMGTITANVMLEDFRI